jgi:C-terminal processing protease CtpA/Prc
MLYLKKNINFSTPFEYNMSGLDVLATGLMLNEFTIQNVKPGSPSDEAGILPGDRILIINGQYAEDLTLNEINHIFHSRPGKKVWMKLLREGKTVKRSFILERII